MRKMLSMSILFVAVSMLPAALAAQTQDPQSNSGAAQDNKPATTSSAADKNVTTATGCLEAGKRTGTYKLMADDGTTYLLRSKSQNLGEHVGHTVTVTGHEWTGEKHASATADNTGSISSDPNAAGNAPAKSINHLMVHKLTMVSDSCKTAQ